MPSLSPQPPAAMPTSPHHASAAGGGGGGQQRPPLMKRHSSQSSHGSSTRHNTVTSPGSVGEHHALRHPVKSRHAKIVLPRNHSSARNLAKLSRQVQQQHGHDEGRKRQRSHEGDTEIRLPGSLGESEQSRPPIKRNMTAQQLPRNLSNVKLKKNLSHGQLTRLGSGRNLAGLNHVKAPPSPGLKGKSKRPKSADLTGVEKEVQEQQLEIARQRPSHQRKGSGKKARFAVGSSGDTSDGGDVPQMEGSGLQEDEWTEESASASPYSTRQNTANNSRRPSVVSEKPVDQNMFAARGNKGKGKELEPRQSEQLVQTKISTDDDSSDAEDSGEHLEFARKEQRAPQANQHSRPSPQQHEPQPMESSTESAQVDFAQGPTTSNIQRRGSASQAREHANPAARRLLSKNHQTPAPALVSNVSALDDTHSNRDSPAPSIRSSRSNIGEGSSEQPEDELVSRFVPSASHPSLGSGPNTAMNTPKQTGFHTPEEDSTLAAQRRERNTFGLSLGPVSPGSTVSGSSGAATPAIGRSRTELRMLQEKAMADLEYAADHRPQLPPHVYDRRNEFLKSFMSNASFGDSRATTSLTISPDVFQGRFRALATELRVVQKFRDPIGEALSRLKMCRASQVSKRGSPQKPPHPPPPSSSIAMSKSAVSLPAQRAQKAAADLSKSASPPTTAKGERQKPGSRGVSFARTPPETREFEPAAEELAPEGIVRKMWEDCLSPSSM